MIRAIAGFILFVGLLGTAGFAQGQSGQIPIQFRLTSIINAKVDYYLSEPGGSPTFVGSVAPGATVELEGRQGQVWLFAVNRVPFQQYRVGGEKFQHLTLAPKEQQRPAQVANEYQGSPDTLQPPEMMGSAGEPQSQAGPADASGLAWQYARIGGQAGQGAAEAQLFLGIPQTDAVQVFATCSVDGNGAAPSALFSSDVSALAARAPVGVRFSAPGFDRTYDGSVEKPESEEGLQGASLAIPLADPFWQALLRLPAVNYSVGGQPAIGLPLNGVGGPLASFLRDCGSSAQAGASAPAQTPATLFQDNSTGQPSQAVSPSGGRVATVEDSCSRLGRMRAKSGGTPVSVTFVNRTDEFRFVLMVDEDGTPIEFANLQGGESFKIDTSTTQPWMMTDGPGNCIEMMMPSADRPVFAITRASPGFGPE